MISLNHIYQIKISDLQLLEDATDDVGYNRYNLHIRYEPNFTSLQPIKLECKFDGVVPNDIKGYALMLTNNLVSISSDGQKHFILI